MPLNALLKPPLAFYFLFFSSLSLFFLFWGDSYHLPWYFICCNQCLGEGREGAWIVLFSFSSITCQCRFYDSSLLSSLEALEAQPDLCLGDSLINSIASHSVGVLNLLFGIPLSLDILQLSFTYSAYIPLFFPHSLLASASPRPYQNLSPAFRTPFPFLTPHYRTGE